MRCEHGRVPLYNCINARFLSDGHPMQGKMAGEMKSMPPRPKLPGAGTAESASAPRVKVS